MNDFNVGSRAVRKDPYPLYKRLRELGVPQWDDVLHGWLVTRYDQVKAALNDPRLSVETFSRPTSDEDRAARYPELSKMGRWMSFADPPAHTRLRALVSGVFTPKVVEAMEPAIQTIVDDLLDVVYERGQMDLIADFAYPLPAIVIAELLGVPVEDRDKFKLWSDDITAYMGKAVSVPDRRERAESALGAMHHYLQGRIEEAHREPSDNLISRMCETQYEGETLSDDEIIATSASILVGGHATTRHLIANAALALLQRPQIADALRANPAGTAGAIDEVLRWDPPVQSTVRIAREDIEIGGARIRGGDFVHLMLAGANRDEDKWENSEDLEVERTVGRHLAFGIGTHYCIGAPLARLEARLAIRTLLERLKGLRLRQDEFEWPEAVAFRGVQRLDVEWELSAASVGAR